MKSPEERKSDIERVFSDVGMKPVYRTKIQGEEIFIADGFVAPSLIDRGFCIKFNAKPGEYPFGAFFTLWWSTQHKGLGAIAIWDALHNPGYSPELKQQKRIEATVHLAKQDIKRRKMH